MLSNCENSNRFVSLSFISLFI